MGLIEFRKLSTIYKSRLTVIDKAVNERTGNNVILKSLNKDYPLPVDLNKFRHEYNILNSLNLPDVIKVYDLVEENNSITIVEEYFDGKSLKSTQFSKLSLYELVKLLIKIAQSIRSIHSQNILHKDINPSNILWDKMSDTVKLIDFGLAVDITGKKDSITSDRLIEGTIQFIPPEQTGRVNLPVDRRSDIYSLGATFYQLLSGQRIFHDITDSVDLIHAQIAKVPHALHEISHGTPKILSDIIMKMLQKSPMERYQSVDGLLEDLNTVSQELETHEKIKDFEVGQFDKKSVFKISDKIYGGPDHYQVLDNEYINSCNEHSRVVIIHGHSGTGKSVFINNFNEQILRKKGSVLSGRYEQFYKNTPYSGILGAFRHAIKLILSEDRDVFDAWKKKILEVLGSNAQVIIDVIPELELVIGKQSPVPELPTLEANNRFDYVFLSFLKAFIPEKNSLVISLDDIQYADSDSLELLGKIIVTYEKKILLVCSYRTNEVDSSHPVFLAINKLKEKQIPYAYIQIMALSRENTNDLLQDTFPTARVSGQIENLTAYVFKKTQGNAFYIKQLLEYLYSKEFIQYDMKSGKWIFKIEEIKKENISESILDLIILKIKMLPVTTERVLQTAALIGNPFEIDILALIEDDSIDEIQKKLEIALQEGLIQPSEDSFPEGTGEVLNQFIFSHNKIQQSFYNAERLEDSGLHLSIARKLFENLSSERLTDYVFLISNCFNKSRQFLRDHGEEKIACQLNLKAALKAKKYSALDAANGYILSALSFLNENCWDADYDMALEIYSQAADIAYIQGEPEKVEAYFKIIRENARRKLDKAKVYQIKILSDKSQDKLEQAIDTALEFLSEYNVKIDKKASKIKVLFCLFKSVLLFKKKPVDTIRNLQEMEDKERLAVMEILSSMESAAFLYSSEFFVLCVIKQVEMSLKYGRSYLTGPSFSVYLLIFCSILDKYDKGFDISNAIFEMSKANKNKRFESRNLFFHSTFLSHWKKPLKKNFDWLMQCYNSAVNYGDIEYAAWSIYVYSLYNFYSGRSLKEVADHFKISDETIFKYNQTKQYLYNKVFYDLVLKLSSDEDSLDDLYEKDKYIQKFEGTSDNTGLIYLHLSRGIFNFFNDDFSKAQDNFEAVEKHRVHVSGTYSIPVLDFYHALSRLQLAHNGVNKPDGANKYGGVNKKQTIRKVHTVLKKFKYIANACPENFESMYCLLKAELHGLKGHYIKAESCYDRAIEEADQNGFTQIAGLSCELAGNFYMRRGMTFVSEQYLSRAVFFFERWGAKLKVKKLKAENKLVIQNGDLEMAHTLSTSITDEKLTEIIDVSSIIKATRTLSATVSHSALVNSFIKIISENVGARKGIFIILKNYNWQVEGSWGYETSQKYLLGNMVIDENFESDVLPISVINYTRRTRQPVILNNASNDNDFSKDRYIITNKPKSLMCMPVILKGVLVGLLYLENNLVGNAFSAALTETLQIITTQAAISFENAKLFQNLEYEVDKRTKELQDLTMKYQELSVTDQLTNIFNRRKIDEVLINEYDTIVSNTGVLSVMLFDIDKFKNVNDVHGHLVGDKVLVFLTKTIQQNLKGTDIFGRWGGEEFIVICPSSSVEDTITAAERLRQIIARSNFPEVKQITCSFGISSTDGSKTIDNCLSDADIALYKAKENGRNKVECKI